jgi:hypothetical protein
MEQKKIEVQRRGEHMGNLVNLLETLWELFGTPKNQKTPSPPNPKETLLSINLHIGHMKNLFKLFLVTIFNWANGKHGEYGCKFVL